MQLSGNMRWRFFLAGTLYVFSVIAARSQEIGADNARNSLNFAAANLVGQSYHRAVPEVLAMIPAGQSKHFTIQLTTGVANAIVVTCGQDCDHVEMSLYDYQRKLLTRSPEKGGVVIMNGNPQYTGLHEVEIAVPGCSASQCEVGLAVLQREPDAAAAPAAAPASREPDDQTLVTDAWSMAELRGRLYELNFDIGSLDDDDVPATTLAISAFEAANKLEPTGQPTFGLLRRLRAMTPLKPWGAIVYMKGAEKWGMSWGHTTRMAAVDGARASCGDQCATELSFFGAQCAAFAHSGKAWAIVARESVQRAKDAALADCGAKDKGCRIIASVCANGADRFSAAK